MKSTDRVKRFRERQKQAGWVEISIKVPKGKEDEVREFAASLGAPLPKKNPAQTDLLDMIDGKAKH